MPTSDLSLKGAMVQSGFSESNAQAIATAAHNPASVGAMNNIAIGATTPSTAAFSTVSATSATFSAVSADFTDSSGTAGAATNNSPRGRVAFAAGASTVVVTNSLVTAASMVIVTLRSIDTALTSVLRVLPTAGSFTITANAASTGALAIADFLVIN